MEGSPCTGWDWQVQGQGLPPRLFAYVCVCVLLPLYICQDDVCRMRPLSGKAENRRRQCFVGVFTNDDAPMIILVSRLYLVLGLASRLLSTK